MPKLIGFGKCSKYYLYILFAIVLKAVKDTIYGFSDIDQRNKEDFQIIKPLPLFCKHNLIQNLFRYIGFILGGFLFLNIKKKNIKSEKDSSIAKQSNSDIKLIYNPSSKYANAKIIEIIIIASIFCIHYELRKFLYMMNFYFLDYVSFNVIFVMLFMHYYFKMNIYNYQKCSLYFIIITNTLLLLINSFLPQHRSNDKNEYDIYADTLGSAALCIPFLFAFIFLSAIISYARVKIKLLTYVKFISNYTIIISIGICGIFYTLIEILFSEIFKCNMDEMNKAFQTLCIVNNTDNEFYHDEFKIFFDEFEKLSSIDIFVNILLMVIFPVICFFEILCELLIIYFLDPIYILVRDNIYYFFERIIFVMLRVDNDIKEYMTPRFFLHEFSEIFAIIGYCIYLQLIELRFCKLDNDLNKNIIARSQVEFISMPLREFTEKEIELTNNNDEIE